MKKNKRILKTLVLSIISLAFLLQMYIPAVATGTPEASGMWESSGVPETTGMQESAGESESEGNTESEYPLEVHFINVGQSEAILISCEGHSMLIDGGDWGKSGRVSDYLYEQKVNSLDYIVVSHGDADHVSGLDDVAWLLDDEHGIVLAPYETWSNNNEFGKFTDCLAANGKEITVPHILDTFQLGSASFMILHAGGTERNESLALRLVYGETSFMFTGDAPESELEEILNTKEEIEQNPILFLINAFERNALSDTMEELVRDALIDWTDTTVSYNLSDYKDEIQSIDISDMMDELESNDIIDLGYMLQSDVLKVPHHGSDTALSEAFLREVLPGHAVMSLGRNSYGHPSDDVLDQMGKLGVTVYRTDNNGHVVFGSNGITVTESAENEVPQNVNHLSWGNRSQYREPEGEPEGQSAAENTDERTDGTGKDTAAESKGEPEGQSAEETADQGAGESAAYIAGESASGTAGESASYTASESGTTKKKIKYVLNNGTKKFHRPDCPDVGTIKAENYEGVNYSKKKIMSKGYKACKHCNP